MWREFSNLIMLRIHAMGGGPKVTNSQVRIGSGGAPRDSWKLSCAPTGLRASAAQVVGDLLT
jgi:hypothetical protein